MFIDFREMGGERDLCERETWIGCLPYTPNQGLNPQTKYVP